MSILDGTESIPTPRRAAGVAYEPEAPARPAERLMSVPISQETVEEWVADVPFERVGPVRRAMKAAVFNPLANYLPASWMRGLLGFAKSELARANWEDPGGWRSMVISYKNQPTQVADKVLVGLGSVPMALRNRRRLGARMLARLMDRAPDARVEALCLGAGPGHIISDAMLQTDKDVHATLVDINTDSFEYGRELAAEKGVADRVRFVEGDVRDVRTMLDRPPNVVKMLGICEYISDDQLVDILKAVSGVAGPGTSVVFNSISRRHGTERFFRRVFGLHMIHRSPEALQSLMRAGGFEDFVGVTEPLGVYDVMIGWRGDGVPKGT